MTESDLKAYKNWELWSRSIDPKIIGLLSCNQQQYNIIHELFPNSEIIQYGINSWNLNNSQKRLHDLIVACNVFHYSDNPQLWFYNVLSCTNVLWIQDIINRYRGNDSQLGFDGDSMRYSYQDFKSSFEHTVDISQFGDVQRFFYYKSEESNSDHFLAEIKKYEH
jgi:hypothetical protein